MAVSKNYKEQQVQENTIRLREVLESLPPFAEEYFRNSRKLTSVRTKLSYAYDLVIFFNYLVDKNEKFKGKQVRELTLYDLDILTPDDIDVFIDYMSYYENKEKNKYYINTEQGKSRKFYSVRSIIKYFYLRRKIKNNPTEFVEAPKITEKVIVHLEVNEVAMLLDEVESGRKLTEVEKRYHEYTKNRDLAIFYTMLGTGIRVSECAGINIEDVDFNIQGIKITRKGGNESIVYFNDEVAEILKKYINERKKIVTSERDENALFLSMQKRRLNIRSIQNIVKKYSRLVTTIKNISPHKLRSTYGTNLYNETGDIYLVADALGHKDINTTRRHYAKMDEQRRKAAAQHVKLRKS